MQRRYLLSLREAKWWILGGIAWAIISFLVFLTPQLRISRLLKDSLWYDILVHFVPTAWAAKILIFTSKSTKPYEDTLEFVPLIILGVLLGALAGYFIKVAVKILSRR